MDNVRFHEVQPSNSKAIFQADDLVDFELDAVNRKLVKNSVEITGTIAVYKNSVAAGNRVVKGDAGNLFIDKNSGAHGVIESISTSTLNQGSIESIGFAYPRMVSMLSVLQNENQDLNDMENVMEWRLPDADLTGNYLRQEDINGTGANKQGDQDFSIKPRILINRCDNNISFSKTGKMRVSMTMAQDEKFLVNQLTGAGVNSLVYTVSNLRLRYRSVPEDNVDMPVLLQKITPLKTTINSNLSNMSLNVPSNSATGCSISFQNTGNEGQQRQNNQQLEKINIDSIQFFFNSANTYLNYKLDNTSEIIMRGLKSLSPSNDEAMYQIKSTDLANNENFIVGSDLDGTIDLSENSFEVEIQSDIATNTNVYLMFHSLVKI